MDIPVLQSMLVIVGPILLALAIAWAIFHNKGSKADIQRTEDATREMYDAQDIDDKVRDNQ